MVESKSNLFSRTSAVATFVIVALVVVAYIVSRLTDSRPASSGMASSVRTEAVLPMLERNSNGSEVLQVPETIVRSMKLSAEHAAASTEPVKLRLTGQLMLDPSRLVHVNTRFDGEVVSIESSVGANNETPQPLRAGDRVQKGQLLAVLWSKEIGEKKSDLVDAISELMQHEATYNNMKSVERTGALTQRSIDEMRRTVEADIIQVERLRRTLRSWRIDDTEMLEIESEANRVHNQSMTQPGLSREQLKADPNVERGWAEVDIRSPIDGEIMEINLAVGDIVSPSDDLFKIADLSRLVVMANAYEEDLPKLRQIPVKERTWIVKLVSQPSALETSGEINTIGSVIDPNQHTAIVQGWIDNSMGNLQVGQFVEVLIAEPNQTGLVEFSNSAIIDEGAKKFVFLALDESLTRVQRREVQLKRRTSSKAYVSSEGELGIKPDERILNRGLLELSDVWSQQSGAAAQH